MTTNTNDAGEAVERKSFEDWYTAGEPNNGFARCHGSDEYLLAPIRQAWQAWQARAALATTAGVVKESLTAAHALPPGIARDDTVHGEMYYTAAQVRAMLAQAAPQPAAPSERERFERYVEAYTGRDIEYHQRNGTTGLEFGWACWQAARAQPTGIKKENGNADQA